MPLSGDPELDALHARVLTEEPIPADAIVWLHGNGYDRGPKVLKLFRSGYAPTIVISGNRTRSPITIDHLADWLMEHGVSAGVVRVDATSLHTRDQSVHVLALAQEYGWRACLLVASPHHQLRAFLTFVQRAREIEWDGRIVNQHAGGDWDAFPSERTQPARAVFVEEIAKCSRYRSHVSTAREGIAHLDACAGAPSACQ